MADKYISAEALTLSLRDDPNLNAASFARVKRHIEAAPDMVKRGRWEWYTDRCEDLFLGCDEDYGWRCSRCKVPLDDEYDPEVMPTLSYCPHCGADMRGEEDGNK